MARAPQTPEGKIRAGILMIILAMIALFAGIVTEIHRRDIKKQCSEYVSGIITDVNSKTVRTRKGRKSRSHTEYRAYISLEGYSALGSTEIVTEWTRTHYRTGDFIKVYYNPNKPSLYYVEGAEPQNGGGLIVVALIFLASGVFSAANGYNERKRIQNAVMQDW